MNKFGSRLKELRIENKLKQSELAEKLDVDQRSISNWETCVREPDFDTLIRIAELFAVSTDYLLGVKDIEG